MNAMIQTFDSLGYFERLKDAGFTELQARVQAGVLHASGRKGENGS